MSDDRQRHPAPASVPPPAESASWLAEFQAMTNDQLKQELKDAFGLTARSIMRCACLVHVLEERGEDLRALKGVGLMVNWLRKVACGQLLPEVLVQFAGSTRLIERISRLTPNDQRRIVSGEPLTVVVPAEGNRGRTVRMMSPPDMTPNQLEQVLSSDGHIRTEAQQHPILDDRREQAARPVPTRIGCMQLDAECKVMRVGKNIITLRDLKMAIKALENLEN